MKTRHRIGVVALTVLGVTAAGVSAAHAAEPAPGLVTFSWDSGVPDGEVVVNLTVEGAVTDGFLTVFACAAGPPAPLTSNVNFRAGQTTSTAAIVPSDADGRVCIETNTPTGIIVDQFEARPVTNAGYGLHPAVRVADTRENARLGAGGGIYRFHAAQAGQGWCST